MLFIIAVDFTAPSVPLWYHGALTSASAGTLFIYTSYKSVSPDLQHKLCQASREITWYKCASVKKKRLHKECWIDVEHV